ATDVHGSFNPLWNPTLEGEARDAALGELRRILGLYDKKLGQSKWFTKEIAEPTAAGTFLKATVPKMKLRFKTARTPMQPLSPVPDYYGAVCFSWAAFLNIDISEFKNIERFSADFWALPGIAAARDEWLAGGPKA
ncbi:hypothetical protein HDU93_003420, partial [Gonapodya sp. JEL0774]